MVNQYQRKPLKVEAVRYDGNNGSFIKEWSNNKVVISKEIHLASMVPYISYSTSWGGDMIGYKNDWIVKGEDGEFSFCNSEAFEKLFEKLD
jgi:hypothetical protein